MTFFKESARKSHTNAVRNLVVKGNAMTYLE